MIILRTIYMPLPYEQYTGCPRKSYTFRNSTLALLCLLQPKNPFYIYLVAAGVVQQLCPFSMYFAQFSHVCSFA